jgi:hypothetical protein
MGSSWPWLGGGQSLRYSQGWGHQATTEEGAVIPGGLRTARSETVMVIGKSMTSPDKQVELWDSIQNPLEANECTSAVDAHCPGVTFSSTCGHCVDAGKVNGRACPGGCS